MRDQLKALENQLVFLQGRILQKKRRTDLEGVTDVLFSPVQIYAWDGFSSFDPTKREPDALVDHLWVRMPSADALIGEMLSECLCCGHVNYYTRADGSIDLAVDVQRAYCLDRLLSDCHDLIQDYNSKGTEALRNALDELGEGVAAIYYHGKPEGGYAFSRHLDLLTFAKKAVRFMKQIRSSADAIDQALESSTANGRCTRLREAAFKAPCRPHRKTQGFA